MLHYTKLAQSWFCVMIKLFCLTQDCIKQFYHELQEVGLRTNH